MQDKILELFFQTDRWTRALAKGFDKDIRKDQLYQLTKPEFRLQLYSLMKDGKYVIAPPHTAQIPKDKPGEFRTVYINEPIDRIILSIANDLFFELMPELVHPSCKSYQKGIGCGKVVREVSQRVVTTPSEVIGWKSDLSKYFDTVPLCYIDAVFDRIDAKYGRSALTDIIRAYYHCDLYFDEHNNLQKKFQSLKQGCAVAAFLADAILYDLDERLSSLDGFYARYSDDMCFIGPDKDKAMDILVTDLAAMDMKLNPKKVEGLFKDRWFKFLGYSIKGDRISLSASRIKTFQKEIEARTIKNRKTTPARALNSVNRFLYKGDGTHSWATQVLPVCNVKKDIDTLNAFVMDALRAVSTGKNKIGGLGYVAASKEGCIDRGKGRNVKANREKTGQRIEGYLSLGCMRNALLTSREAYNTLVMSI